MHTNNAEERTVLEHVPVYRRRQRGAVLISSQNHKNESRNEHLRSFGIVIIRMVDISFGLQMLKSRVINASATGVYFCVAGQK